MSKEQREKLLSKEWDGEFWMAYKDFVANFDFLEVCYLGPDSMKSDTLGGIFSFP